MKINEILTEAKFSKDKIIGYHATPRLNLRSIIKNGLLPDKHDGWGSDGTHGTYNYSTTSLEGVYFTRSFHEAYRIGRDIGIHNTKDGQSKNYPIIVICEIQPKSVFMDEDVIGDIVLLDNDVESMYNKIQDLDYNEESIFKNYANELTNDSLNIIDRKLRSETDLTYTSIKNIINVARPHINNYIVEILHSVMTGEQIDIRYEQDVLRKLLKPVITKSQEWVEEAETFSVNQRIGFSGASKIVGIMDFKHKRYWGRLAQKLETKSGWTEVSTPIELLQNKRS